MKDLIELNKALLCQIDAEIEALQNTEKPNGIPFFYSMLDASNQPGVEVAAGAAQASIFSGKIVTDLDSHFYAHRIMATIETTEPVTGFKHFKDLGQSISDTGVGNSTSPAYVELKFINSNGASWYTGLNEFIPPVAIEFGGLMTGDFFINTGSDGHFSFKFEQCFKPGETLSVMFRIFPRASYSAIAMTLHLALFGYKDIK